MNPKQVKIYLIEKDLTIQGIAKKLCRDNQSEQAIRVMISQMIHGHRYYPALAKRLKTRFGVAIPRPSNQQLKKVA